MGQKLKQTLEQKATEIAEAKAAEQQEIAEAREAAPVAELSATAIRMPSGAVRQDN